MTYFKILLTSALLYITGCKTITTSHHITLDHNINIKMEPVNVNMKHKFDVDNNKTRTQLQRLIKREINNRNKAFEDIIEYPQIVHHEANTTIHDGELE